MEIYEQKIINKNHIEITTSDDTFCISQNEKHPNELVIRKKDNKEDDRSLTFRTLGSGAVSMR